MTVQDLEKQLLDTIRAYENEVGMPEAERRTKADGLGRIALKSGQGPIGEMAWAIGCVDRLRYADEVDRVTVGETKPLEIVNLGMTPELLVMGGFERKPLAYTQRHLLDAIHEKSSNISRYHGLPVEVIKRMPELLESPVAICDSPARRDVALVLLREVDAEGCPLIAAVKPNAHATYESREIECNIVLSVYGKKNATRYFQERVGSARMAYLDKEKANELEALAGLQLPRCHQRARKDIIRPLECARNLKQQHHSKRRAKTPEPSVVFASSAGVSENMLEWRVYSNGKGCLFDWKTERQRFQFDAASDVDETWMELAERLSHECGGKTPEPKEAIAALKGLEMAPVNESRIGSFLKRVGETETRYLAPIGGLRLSVIVGNGETSWKIATNQRTTLAKGVIPEGAHNDFDAVKIATEAAMSTCIKLSQAPKYPKPEEFKEDARLKGHYFAETETLSAEAYRSEDSAWVLSTYPKGKENAAESDYVTTYGESFEEAYAENVDQRKIIAGRNGQTICGSTGRAAWGLGKQGKTHANLKPEEKRTSRIKMELPVKITAACPEAKRCR